LPIGTTKSAFDFVVIGAGLLGLATARELLRRLPGARLAVLEKEGEITTHQSGRNSGVIHSGIYYAPGSLKAQLCLEGSRRLKRYCDERPVPYVECGKLIVATQEGELPGLAELYRRGVANQVPGLSDVEAGTLREIEPEATGIRGIYCAKTAIVDYRRVAAALREDVLEDRSSRWTLAAPLAIRCGHDTSPDYMRRAARRSYRPNDRGQLKSADRSIPR
jgi:L-2-hydroxyglutarate oxidase LhgO